MLHSWLGNKQLEVSGSAAWRAGIGLQLASLHLAPRGMRICGSLHKLWGMGMQLPGAPGTHFPISQHLHVHTADEPPVMAEEPSLLPRNADRSTVK